ncbi:flagellar basal body-associated FliL family protein [Chenggangzhangella methanolivorans]|uniref:Flagellar protein FliL n=1 Tax=Chenggangzhangella methanolivorans TaxID=1437009 RepID=A0A9E6UNE3_9HYPH|nr:flagellar basal body-associated FliL family protein [Chenggangzhangella methanolivorans]QZO00991.1 flagellar basal body-associated FliL family protein [Chenggangzhangella methanolivorans]
MADENEAGAAAEGKPKSKKKLIIIAGAAAAALLIGGGGAFFMMKGGKEDGHGEAHAEASGGHGEEKAEGGHGGGHGEKGAETAGAAFVDLPEMTVNLATVDREKQRYVRLSVALEVDEAKSAETIKPMMPRVLDSFQTHLRELRPDDIRGSSGVYRLKEELLRRVNTAVAPAKVDAVLFKEIIVQ